MSYNYTNRLDHTGTRMSQVNGKRVLFSDKFAAPTFTMILDGVSRGQTTHEELGDNGVITVTRMICFFVDVNQFAPRGAGFKPAIGMQIRDSQGRVYQIQAPPNNLPAVALITPSEKRYRIHTIRVS